MNPPAEDKLLKTCALFLQTCQVRVVRFYVSYLASSPSPSPPPPPRLLNRECQMAAFRAPRRTSTTSSRRQCSPPYTDVLPQHCLTQTCAPAAERAAWNMWMCCLFFHVSCRCPTDLFVSCLTASSDRRKAGMIWHVLALPFHVSCRCPTDLCVSCLTASAGRHDLASFGIALSCQLQVSN